MILRQNDIPDSRVSITCINTGQGVAKDVRMRISVEGIIREALTDPIPSDHPVWVAPPDTVELSEDRAVMAVTFKDLAPGKPVSAFAAFNSSEVTSSPVADVFFDGRPAIQIRDLVDAPRYTLLEMFKLPLWILGIGVGITVIVAGIVVLKNNPPLAKKLGEALGEFLRTLLESSVGRI